MIQEEQDSGVDVVHILWFTEGGDSVLSGFFGESLQTKLQGE